MLASQRNDRQKQFVNVIIMNIYGGLMNDIRKCMGIIFMLLSYLYMIYYSYIALAHASHSLINRKCFTNTRGFLVPKKTGT